MKKAVHGLEPIVARALELVAEGLESGALAKNFYMGNWRKNSLTEEYESFSDLVTCGTVCCIHGWVGTLLEQLDVHTARYVHPTVNREYFHLCMGAWSHKRHAETNPLLAVPAIRHFLRTGKCPTPAEIAL